ncbi:MAG: rhodanese-like domain-containing protein [Pseudomonadota bacterium]
MNKIQIALLATAFLAVQSTASFALDVKLTPEKDTVKVKHQGKSVTVQRIQDTTHVVDDSWGKTSRKCPPFCSQPIEVAPGVKVAGEVEVFEFMETHVNKGTGLLIDARVESWHKKGTIPGSINIPFTEFQRKTGPELEKIMKLLGATKRSGVGMLEVTWDKTLKTIGLDPKRKGFWDFNNVKEVMLWCNGPWCGQSPHAIRGLLSLGFPADKIHYYRGGMQMWLIMGLSTVKPQ